MNERRLMSIKALAALIGVSTDTVRRAARSGLIPSTRKGSAYRFDWPKVRQAMSARTKQRPYRRSKVAGAPGGDSRPRAGDAPDLEHGGLADT